MSSRFVRAISRVAIAALFASALVVGVVAPASAAGTTVVSGHVYLGDASHSAGAGEVLVTVTEFGHGTVTTLTDASGNYSVSAENPLSDNAYLGFTYQGAGSFGNAYWPGVATKAGPALFQLTYPTMSGMDITLQPPADVSGQVLLGPSGTPAPAGDVRVVFQQQIDFGWGPESSVLVGANGNWVAPALPAGNYGFRYEYLGSDGYASIPYPSTVVMTPIKVWGVAQTLPAVTMFPSYSISGKVTLGDGGPAAGAGQVKVTWSYSATQDVYVPDTSRSVLTDSMGDYIITGLQLGSYRLRYEWVGSPAGVFGSYTTSYPDINLYSYDTNEYGLQTTLPSTWAVSGHVDLDAAGHSAVLGQVKVSAHFRDGLIDRPPVASTLTDANGSFVLGLPTSNDYYLSYEYVGTDDSYPSWYSANGIDGLFLDQVAKHLLDIHSNVAVGNVVVGHGPSIAGTVSDSSGNPLGGQLVRAYPYLIGGPADQDPSYAFATTTTTRPDGGYRFRGLEDGYDYVIDFGGDVGGNYAYEAWDDESIYYYANDVLVPVGDTSLHGGIDAELEHPAAISGTITVSGQVPADFNITTDLIAEVLVRDGSSNTWVETGDVYNLNSAGGYSVTGLKPDDYRISVFYVGSGPLKELRSGVLLATEGANLTYSSTMTLKAPTIAEMYASLGGASGQLGAAVSAVGSYPNAGGGSLQHFANGTIYASNVFGTHVVWAGPIRETYWAANSITGDFGWPIGDRDCVTGTCTQSFMGGSITPTVLGVIHVPTVTGANVAGATLTATSGSYSPTASSYTYQWKRDGAVIAGATAATYVPGAADVGHTLRVDVTATRAGSLPTVTPSASTAVIRPSALMQIATLYASLGGSTGQLGAATSAAAAFPDNGGGTLQHFANGSIYSSNVSGTWVVWAGPIRDAYWAANSILGVYKWPSGAQVCTAGVCTQQFIGGSLQAAPLVVNVVPTITGAARVGGTLFANAGSYAPAATSVKYAWIRDGVRISGATASTYALVAADAGHTLKVEVTASRTGSVSTVTLSVATAAIGPSAAMEIASLYATLGGSGGQLGTATSDAVAFPDNGGGTLQHFTNGSIYSSNVSGTWVVWAGPIRDAYWAARSIQGVYKWPSSAQVCSAGTCTQQFIGGTLQAAPLTVNVVPTITGATRVGGTLFANAGSYSPAATSVKYAWLRDGVRISGASSSTLALTAADAGHTVTVEVTASRTGSVSTVTLSAATVAIAPSGAMQIATLYASLGGSAGSLGGATSDAVAFPDNGGGTLQHFVNGSIYSSNVSGTWVVWAGPIRDAYWAARSIQGVYKWPSGAQACSAGICTQQFIGGVLQAAPLTVNVVPTITGATRVGGTALANAGSYSPAATSVKYAWLRDGVRISGATSSSWVLVPADAGHTLQVEVTASRAGSVSTVTLSAATAAITPSGAMQVAALYASLGGAGGQLGAATSDAVAFPDNGGGTLQHFVKGSIYSSNVSGTWVVWAGPIRDAYWAARSIQGVYKWPSGDQTCSAGTCTQPFIGGTITR